MSGKPHIDIIELLPIGDRIVCRFYDNMVFKEATKQFSNQGQVYQEVENFRDEVKSGKIKGKEIKL